MGADRPDEFETIARLLKPLATHPAARGLTDDAAVLPLGERDLVLTHDTMVEGVHFLPDDPPDTVAQKLLRVNLSDLAAKGAEPFGYLMSTAWSARCDWAWREAFARGLAEDQREFGLTLLGGDTVSTPGPLTVGATLLGWAPGGKAPARSGARDGDLLLVSGPIGDGLLGLQAAQGKLTGPGSAVLIEHYRRPVPRLDCVALVRRYANASADVSDGLIADAGRIAEASGIGLGLDLDAMPLSEAGEVWLAAQPDITEALAALATGGDDYQILMAVSRDRAAQAMSDGIHLGVKLTPLGVFGGAGLRVLAAGAEIAVERTGWRHR